MEKGKSGERGGRCPIYLKVHYDTFNMLAVEVGIHSLVGTLSTLDNRELHRQEVRLKRGAPIVEKLKDFIGEMRQQKARAFKKTTLIYVSCPGVVDARKGVLLNNIYHKWHDIPLADELEAAFGKPVYVENDANTAAFGELDAQSEEERIQSMIYLFLRGSFPGGPLPLGVGGTIIVGGHFWHGAHFRAGEIGRTINQHFASAMEPRRGEEPPAAKSGDHNLLATVMEAADQGDRGSKRRLDRLAKKIGGLLAEMAEFIDPQAVMVHIDPPEHQSLLWKAIEKEFHEHYGAFGSEQVDFLEPRLGNNAGVGGLLALGRERIFIRDSSHPSLLFA